MKLSVICHSQSGVTMTMAEAIVRGARQVEGVEARAFSIDAVDEVFARESRCVILGSPIYHATISHQMKTWLDTQAGKSVGFAGKLVGAFSTSDYVHGGGELGIQLMLTHMIAGGGMAYSGGSAWGRPFIHIGPQALRGHLEEYMETFEAYGERMARQAATLFG